MQNISDYNSNIPLGVAITRRNNDLCINCGQPQVHKELASCAAKKCITEMRKVNQWAKEVYA